MPKHSPRAPKTKTAARRLTAPLLPARPAVRRYAVHYPGFAGRMRLALVSDLHSHTLDRTPGTQHRLLAALRELRPHFILLAGDIIDDLMPTRNAEAFLTGAAEIAPTYFAFGNHEYRGGLFTRNLRIATACGTQPLIDTAVTLTAPCGGSIWLAGVQDAERELYDPHYSFPVALRTLMAQKPTDIPAVLLAHRPEHIELYRRHMPDIVLSGHTHGGQVRLPLLRGGLYAPGQGFLPRYGGGLYSHSAPTGHTLKHIISRGIALSIPLPRVFNPPEIALIEIRN